MAFLELTGVQKRFGDVAAVEDFDLDAERGEFVSFLGPSGCGKTTTLRMIAGFEQPTSGTITIDGEDITQPAAEPAQRRHGLPVLRPVPEHDRRRQHRLRAARSGSGPKAEIRKRVGELLELINLPEQGGPLPVPAVGRPAAARRARPRAGDRAAGAAARRAAVGARRQDPDRAAQGDPGDPAPARDHDGLRHPRPGGGALAVRPGRGHERGPDRADRHAVRDLQLPERRRSWPRSSGRSTWSSAGVVDAGGRARCRSTARRSGRRKAIDRGRAGRPGDARPAARGHRARRGRDGDNRLRGHDRGHQLPRLDRPDPGQRRRGRRRRDADDVSLDTFNDPHLELPAVGRDVTVSFPPEACFVLGAARRRRGWPTRGGRRATV